MILRRIWTKIVCCYFCFGPDTVALLVRFPSRMSDRELAVTDQSSKLKLTIETSLASNKLIQQGTMQ